MWGQAGRLLLKDIVSLVLFYFIAKFFFGEEKWFTDKTHELITFLLIGLVFYIFSLGVYLIKRPLTIRLHQSNSQYDKTETNFSIRGSSRTQEHERLVEMVVNIERSISFWGKLVAIILKRSRLSILVEPVTSGIVIEADNEAVRNDITSTTKGFIIEINENVSNIIDSPSEGNHGKTCEYIISEDRDHIVSNETIHIVPMLYRNGERAPTWCEFLVRFETQPHVVNFKWE